MQQTIRAPGALHEPQEAQRLAALLTAEEQEEGGSWTYRARQLTESRSLIEIFDEAGELVGEL